MTQPHSYLPLYTCLRHMDTSGKRTTTRLRFVSPTHTRLDFHYFRKPDRIHIYLRPRPKAANIHLGHIDNTGRLHQKHTPSSHKFTEELLLLLTTDFPSTIYAYGQATGYCALCGHPLIDPASLARGTTPTCTQYLTPPAQLKEI